VHLSNEKTAIAGGFFRISVCLVFCFYVNLPLFLRLGAGVAKVKVKVETGKGHGVSLLAGKNSGGIVQQFGGICKRGDLAGFAGRGSARQGAA
jgi:hypothetical protein